MKRKHTYIDNIIIKALKSGVPVSRIQRETKVPARTLWHRIKTDREYKIAYEFHKTLVDNIFK